MTVPIIDGIDHETFEYRSVYQDHQHFRGIFEWGMLYKVSFYFLELIKFGSLDTNVLCLEKLPVF